MDRVRLLNIEIDNFTMKEFLEELTEGVVITPNVDHMIKLQHDREFYALYQKAEYVVLDSKILFRALKYLGTPVKEVIAGSDLFPAFYRHHSENEDIRIFLLGAGPGVGKKAMENINEKVGREIITGWFSPDFGFEKDPVKLKEVVEIVHSSGANVLAVGLGAPKQEKWIFANRDKLAGVKIFLAIGATIDFEAGNVKRAPAFFRNNSLEWLYRMFAQPRRLIRRYLVDDLPIFSLVYRQKKGKYKNPFAE